MKNLCKICSSKTESFYNEIFKVTYHICPNCQLIFKEPQDLISKDDEFNIYEKHENSITDPTYVSYFKRFLKSAVCPYVKGGKEGLDFGSGPSPVLAMILERDYGYTMDIYDLFFSPEKVYLNKNYDLIVSTEVVEHFANPLEEFQTMKNALKEEGILAVMTQFHHNDIEHFNQWYYMRDRSHIAFYTSVTMAKIAELLDMEIVFSNNENYTTFQLKI